MSEYSYVVGTDRTPRIKVKSKLIYAIWIHSQAHAGLEAELEVRTAFVGDSAKIKITCYTESGKKLDKVEGRVFNNRYRGKVLIPEKIKKEEMIYFEAELPKHRLKIESNLIPVRPSVIVSRMGWDRKEVRRGEIVRIMCDFESGVEDGDEVIVAIYEHNPNSCDIKVVGIPVEIKDKKIDIKWRFDYQDPTDMICTQEELEPYGKRYHNPDFYFVVIVDGIRVGEDKESGLMRFRDSIDIDVRDFESRVLADSDCTVVFADGSKGEYRTNGNGRLLIPDIPPGPFKVELKEIGRVVE